MGTDCVPLFGAKENVGVLSFTERFHRVLVVWILVRVEKKRVWGRVG